MKAAYEAARTAAPAAGAAAAGASSGKAGSQEIDLPAGSCCHKFPAGLGCTALQLVSFTINCSIDLNTHLAVHALIKNRGSTTVNDKQNGSIREDEHAADKSKGCRDVRCYRGSKGRGSKGIQAAHTGTLPARGAVGHIRRRGSSGLRLQQPRQQEARRLCLARTCRTALRHPQAQSAAPSAAPALAPCRPSTSSGCGRCVGGRRGWIGMSGAGQQEAVPACTQGCALPGHLQCGHAGAHAGAHMQRSHPRARPGAATRRQCVLQPPGRPLSGLTLHWTARSGRGPGSRWQ